MKDEGKSKTELVAELEALRQRVTELEAQAVQIVALNEAITERKQLQVELARFRAMMDQSDEIILVVDPPTGRNIDVNETACRLLGYSREELKQLTSRDIVV